jgi:hypothetical protein
VNWQKRDDFPTIAAARGKFTVITSVSETEAGRALSRVIGGSEGGDGDFNPAIGCEFCQLLLFFGVLKSQFEIEKRTTMVGLGHHLPPFSTSM